MSLKDIYEKHHKNFREEGFSILGEERGELFSKIIGKGKKVLDVGCRDGSLTKHFLEGNVVTGIDIDTNALSRAKEKYGMKTIYADLGGDWHEIDGDAYDCIIAGEVLEHLYYPEDVVRKVFKHLKDDGIFLGSVPNAFSLKNRLRYLKGEKKNTPLEDPTHINQFSVQELQNLFGKYFKNVEIIGLGRYKKLARFFPNWFAFDIAFKLSEKK
jgi:2-polyprenyl-3-methyl-5-hydroxy-6-metoxy-1,4-benzoquinol methylase